MGRFLNQTNFPHLWLLFQYAIGGNVDKKRLILKTYRDERNVLEVGCSVGNVADAFRSVKGVSYQGVDIDSSAIAVAQRRFAGSPNFAFLCGDLNQLAHRMPKFDLIYFAGVLHHVPDAEAGALLQSAVGLLAVNARLLVIEPRPALADDPRLVRWYAGTLEQGHYLRPVASLERIIHSVYGLTFRSTQLAPIGATPLSWPLCAQFIVIESGRAG